MNKLNKLNITKPLTVHLRSENGRIGKKMSSKTKIDLDKPAINAFETVKSKIQEQIELFQPDFSKAFELTTDASNFAIGAVLSQNQKPITFISRTLNKTEQNYATNEKELLAIVWALKNLRNYLYGIVNFTIFTDHQPLTSAICDKNPNLKLKRWMAFIEESGANIQYTTGKQNVVADALSRQSCFHLLNDNSDSDSDSDSIHSSPSSPETDCIPKTTYPLNIYKNQFIIEKSSTNELKTTTLFDGYVLHTLKFSNNEYLITNMGYAINAKTINALFTSEEIFFRIHKILKTSFPDIKFIFTPNNNRNITDPSEQEYLMISEHERAHRHYFENFKQLREKYFFPKMKQRMKAYTVNCEICKKQKFDTHPKKQTMNATPIPSHVGEYLQIDVFHAGNRIYYSTIDRFSKFAILRYTENKLNASEIVEEILQMFPHCKHVMTDNKQIFVSFPMKSLFQRRTITHSVTPIKHSTTNAQVERFHRTLIEIARCLAEQKSLSFEDVIFDAVREYNNTIHSVTNVKPVELFFNSSKYPHISDLIQQSQTSMLKFQNKNRDYKHFEPGAVIFAKDNRRDKRSASYNKYTVQEDRDTMIVTTTGKLIHKDNIRQ